MSCQRQDTCRECGGDLIEVEERDCHPNDPDPSPVVRVLWRCEDCGEVERVLELAP
jgi:RNase P subunit RPR2